MGLFRKNSKPLKATLVRMDGTSIDTKSSLDTGARLNLVCEEWIPDTWSAASVATDFHRLLAAVNEPMKAAKGIPFQVRLADLTMRVWFGVVKCLDVKVLLGTSFKLNLSCNEQL